MRRVAALGLAHLICAPSLPAQDYPVGPAARCGVPDSAQLESERRAYRYAPTMHFAPQERYFPILPFFNSFLHVGDSSTASGAGTPPTLTPARIGQLAQIGQGPDSLILWNALAKSYDSLQIENRKRLQRRLLPTLERLEAIDASLAVNLDPSVQAALKESRRQALLSRELTLSLYTTEWVPQVAALFYRDYELSEDESKAVWDRVRSDFQIWSRANLPDSLRFLNKKSTLPRLRSLEYYAYYIRDLGLTGHPQDLEKFFVFVPMDSTSVQIMVGAAHSVVTPNNVVVLAQKEGGLGSYLYPTHALVEYGGHSFSPDVPPLGAFTPGWDINWRASERSWGVRDIQAILGTGFSGDYHAQYTLPRSDSIGVTLEPLDPAACLSQDTTTGHSPNIAHYALISIEDYKKLFDSLATTQGDTTERVQRVRSAWEALGSVLERKMWPALRFPSDSAGGVEAYRRLQYWLKDLAVHTEKSATVKKEKTEPVPESGSKMRPWTATEYGQRPEHIMKAWLYRPQDPDRSCAWWQFTPLHSADFRNFETAVRYGIGRRLSHTGLLLEVIDGYHCIERASKLGIPGTLSFGVEFSPFNPAEGPLEFQLRYQHRYFSPQSFTWSLSLGYVASYDSTESANLARDCALEAAASAPLVRACSIERSRVRVRPALSFMPIGMLLGAKMDPTWLKLVLASIAIRVGPQIDLLHPSRSMAWQLELGFRPFPKFRPGSRRPGL